MQPITGAIITYNEEDHIEDCVASLRQVCAEVLVVDSLSTDRTVELAQAAGARVVAQEYLGDGKQRNITEANAGHDWILALDADERLDDRMRDTIRRLELSDPGLAYAFNRKSFIGGRWIRGPGFYPDYVTRLYNRTRAAYEPIASHAGVVAPKVRRMPGHILHYTYDSISDWIAKLNWLTSQDALNLMERGVQPSRFKPLMSGAAAAFRQLVLRGGLFRGMDAWTITLTSVFRAYMKYLKLNELHQQSRQGSPSQGGGLGAVGRYRSASKS